MVFRRKFKTKKYGGKKVYKKKWSKKRMTKKNSNRVLVKLKKVYDVPVLSGEASFRLCLSNINYDTQTDTISVVSEFSSAAALYDSHRPCAVKIKFIPLNNVSSITTTPTFYSNEPMYTCVDWNNDFDDTFPTFAQMVEYNNFKFKNSYRPQQWYYKLKKLPQNLNRIAANTTVHAAYEVESQSQLGYFSTTQATTSDLAADISNTYPRTCMFYLRANATNFADDYIFGKFLCTYYYAFKNRR